MAINKKLKKFDDNGTYRNFLTTSDFERPDVSSIGAGSVPQNLDVEYNPTRMLFLNAKYRLFPTSTKIEFVIDTITNGTVGCWYKPSTGSTYTKLNSTDLTFYSAYTQNRVTNLTFDTIGAFNLSDECNIIYALSAKSSADASITASDTCVQRGLISLTGENFPSSGGSISYQIKTASENPWKITNTNSWLTFSTLTGTGPTTVVISATEWTDTTQGRTGTVKLEYTDMEYSVQTTITQNKLNKFFYVGNSVAQATTTACTYASTVGSADTSDKYVYYKTVGYDVSSLNFYKDDMFASVSFESGDRIKFNLNINPNPNDRTGIILIRDNSTIIAQITVSQQAKRIDYFYVGNTASEATTSACTYATTVSSAAGSYSIYYSTNYTAAELGTLTFQPDTMFQSASFATSTTAGTINVSVKENSMGSPSRSGNIWIKSGSTNIAKITFNQSAGATPPVNYFYWGNSGSATTSGGSATYNSTSITCSYRTNISSLTTATTDSWIISATLNNGTFTVNFNQNSTYVERTATIQIKNGSTVVGTFNLTQESAPTPNYFYWGNTGSATTTAVTVTSAATTTGNIPYRTNYSSLTTATTDSWITAATISSGNFAASFAANPNTTDRTGTVQIKSGSDVVGTINITQLAKAYFLWSNGATAITQTIAATTTIASATYTTNMTGLIVESAASYTWVTDKGITNPSGNGTFSATTQQNSSVRTRTSEFLIKTGSITVGKLTLEQAGVDYENEYLTFVALEDGAFRFSGSRTTNTLSYSLDNGSTWVLLPYNTDTAVVQSGNTIMWKGTCIPYTDGIGYFTSNGKFNAEGNVMSLLYGDSFVGETSLGNTGGTFTGLFRENSQLMSAENMKLPATTLANNCYSYMFEGCTGLTSAPELPATTLVTQCYQNMFDRCTSLTTAPELPATGAAESCYLCMFQGCTSLTSAPELPAIRLAIECYSYMFYNCRALTTAPELPATTLADKCYDTMFEGCTGLTSAPELPATTLVTQCYQNMFRNCTNLNYIKCLATDIRASYCTYNWVNGVASSGTFVKAQSMTSWEINSVNGIPSGWVVEDTHEYVEIAGIKWATMNIGAENPWDYGLYFQWGDISGYTASQVGTGTGKKYFGWPDYKYGNGTSNPGATGMTKYNSTDGKTTLDLSDDGVNAAWGGNWRMPTTDEFAALGAATTSAWTTDYQGTGVKGLVLTDKTDSSKVLFFPAAGCAGIGHMITLGNHGYYWSGSLYSSDVINGRNLRFNSSTVDWQGLDDRGSGFSLRGVVGE